MFSVFFQTSRPIAAEINNCLGKNISRTQISRSMRIFPQMQSYFHNNTYIESLSYEKVIKASVFTSCAISFVATIHEAASKLLKSQSDIATQQTQSDKNQKHSS